MKKIHTHVITWFCKIALLTVFGTLMVVNANAMTLAKPVVLSTRGEPLNIEIEIVQISKAEQKNLKVNIASNSAYESANVVPTVSDGVQLIMQVQMLSRKNGRSYLRVTSRQPVNTNVVDLLIEMRWATGRILHDYSLAIDETKAETYSTFTPVVADPLPQAEPVVVKAREPICDCDNADSFVEVSGKNKGNRRTQILVRRGDTASGILAGRTPLSVSLDQMLLALLRHNPDAFVKSNVNRLRTGALLTLPTAHEANATSRAEARHEIRLQARDFQAYRAELAARASGGVIAKAARDTTGNLEAMLKSDSSNSKNQDKLTLTKSTGNSGSEERTAKQLEEKDIAARVNELSRNVADLNKIAAVTSDHAPASGSLSAPPPPASAWIDNSATIPMLVGSMLALLILGGLWMRRSNQLDRPSSMQGLQPLDVKFNLDLPEHEEPVRRASYNSANRATRSSARSSTAGFDSNSGENQYQVRFDVANELWKLGQTHTSKALMEEIANDSTGLMKEKALQWLAERS